jgi:hypothetical protein
MSYLFSYFKHFFFLLELDPHSSLLEPDPHLSFLESYPHLIMGYLNKISRKKLFCIITMLNLCKFLFDC